MCRFSLHWILVGLAGTNAGASRGSRPHIVSIISDDLGFFDRSSAGNKNVSTPGLDYLFESGIHLSRFYAYKYCSPSRRSFVTGRWPLHLGEENQLEDGIDLRMSTLGDKLASVGYVNVLIGKTHWGTKTPQHLPINRGWASHVGYLGGAEAYYTGHECVIEQTNCNNFTKILDFWHDHDPAEASLIGQYSTSLFTDLAVDAIRNHSANSDAPLWLHLNYQAVHNPHTSPPGEPKDDDDDDKVYYEVLEAMSRGIANVTQALQEVGLWDNTLVIFMSDNGGASKGNNYPLRGGKYDPFDGGVRLAAALAGGALPDHASETTFDGVVHVSDIYPTVCALAGVDASDDPPSDDPKDWFWPVDGLDVWDYVTGTNSTSPRQDSPLVISSPYTSGPGGGAMLINQYKIVVNVLNKGWDLPPNQHGAVPRLKGNSTCIGPGTGNVCLICSVEEPCIYDVWSDPSEFHNIAKREPDLLRQMNTTYAKLVYERRMPDPLNFTKDNGWDCDNSTGLWEVREPPSCKAEPDKQCYRTNDHTLFSLTNCSSASDCCAACAGNRSCATFVFDRAEGKCFALTAGAPTKPGDDSCLSGTSSPSPSPSGECPYRWKRDGGCYMGPDCICLSGPGECNTTTSVHDFLSNDE